MIGKMGKRALLLDEVLLQMQQRKTAAGDSLQAYPKAVEELRPLLETAEQAAGLLQPAGPSPEFLRASETRLLRKIRTAGRQDSRPQRTAPFAALWQRVPAAAVVFILAVALVLGSGWGVSSASAQALPGDALFPVKLGLEQAELTVSTSEAGDVALLAKFADKRIGEIQELVQQGRFSDLETGFAEYENTLNRLDSAVMNLSADEGLAELIDVEDQLGLHTDILAGIRDEVPAQAQSALDRVLDRSKKSKDLAEQLRTEKDPQSIPPGQAKKTQKNDAAGKSKTKNGKSADSNGTPKATRTRKPSNTPKLTKTPKPTKTDKPSATPKVTSTHKFTKTPKPTKE
jgi:hypothetical protein